MKSDKISEAVVRRLPVYLRYLNELHTREVPTVSSQELGQKLDLNPAQIRKDLAYFGDFGRKGIGYDVSYLIEKIRHILKLDQQINVALVGAGNLGHALSNYNMYLKETMKIVAVFDSNDSKVGSLINTLVVQPIDELGITVKARSIRIGIVTVPNVEAQRVADQLIEAGVEAILNFAPIILKAPPHIRVHTADFTTDLLSLAYYLEDGKEHETNE
ncbi:redox-sensing transcriptional repressor Rex [Paenibacillus sp. PsM32]|jgi:redox-sensing transcriptional repressor|uniref:Redox-sensing transcriptional repressor Rex n=1 Tax=Paenibacillus kyungheensis TaxID=1452732 RepID=A0AAX3LYG1_9BACL|nr:MULTISPECIES: redox-sensing transcriptional repressor Rex [Paenibacillus]MDN4617983.1 redox-sensing transcriptional repressor Rex [Paenibacillus sp. PsM32]MDQ1234704.1 redox-sensing transcriptional repressor [Paenibacillus sp. SORGH_AS_0306]MDR6111749.1 redox-sensing transcriptional repressor [Paenibacillus sp. SORGH_AS_0338]WCT54298.1 redox-sensing transcriptional repressor Rex [Paenibacillus kyungheensis]WDF52572.1 redox-sensing transcriptional repressor Rex [Paenibacillus sp. KACC 21273]